MLLQYLLRAVETHCSCLDRDLLNSLFLSFGKFWWMGRCEVLSKGQVAAFDSLFSFKLKTAQKAQHITTPVETMVSEAEGENWSKSGKLLLHDKSSPIGTLMSLPAIINMLFKARDALWLLGLFNWFVFVGNKLWTCNHKWFLNLYQFFCRFSDTKCVNVEASDNSIQNQVSLLQSKLPDC